MLLKFTNIPNVKYFSSVINVLFQNVIAFKAIKDLQVNDYFALCWCGQHQPIPNTHKGHDFSSLWTE